MNKAKLYSALQGIGAAAIAGIATNYVPGVGGKWGTVAVIAVSVAQALLGQAQTKLDPPTKPEAK